MKRAGVSLTQPTGNGESRDKQSVFSPNISRAA